LTDGDGRPAATHSPDLWWHENQTDSMRLAFRVDRVVVDRSTRFQRLTILDTSAVGRVLVLDGAVQMTELDEAMYHEMLVHPALMSIPPDRREARVLIVGGGDGGAAREVLKHRWVGHLDLVDIDEEVVEACREHLPGNWKRRDGSTLDDDPRFRIHFGDGFAWAADRARQGATYDVVVVDSTDPVPWGPGRVLFRPEFYHALARLATVAVVVQAGSPLYQSEVTTAALQGLRGAFDTTFLYTGPTPTYPGGIWSYAGASPGDAVSATVRDEETFARRIDEIEAQHGPLRCYTRAIHSGAFALPAFVRDLERSALAEMNPAGRA
jgi:spermidine synthase